MTPLYSAGIDIGTGSVKAVVMDQSGSVVYTSQVFYPKPVNETSEQDPLVILDSFQQLICSLAGHLEFTPQIICLSCAMHSVIAVDKEGKPLTKAILWSDTRSSNIAESLRESEVGRTLYEATGTPIHAMSPLCKIKWLRDNAAQIFQKTFKFISIKEFIWHRLFNEFKIDHSMASATGLFNIHSLTWEPEALEFAGITEDQLSEPVAVSYVRKPENASIASDLQLPANTIFCIGASDGCLANYGVQSIGSSGMVITIGTSAAVRVATGSPLIDYEKMIFNYRLNEQSFISGGAINNAGNAIAWLVEKLLGKELSQSSYDSVIDALSMAPAGCKGLLFLPYLHGERAPIWDEQASGAFIGILSYHDQYFFARAVIEGICFALKDILFALENKTGSITDVKLCGGVAQYKSVTQILSDVLNKPVEVENVADASSLGAAYLGLEIIQPGSDFRKKKTGKKELILPNGANAELYSKLFTIYKELYSSLKTNLHLLTQYH